MSNKTSDENVANIEDDVKIVKEFIDYAQEVIDDMEYERPVDVTVYQKDLTSIKNILAEREQMLKAINTVEKEKGDWIKAYQEEKDSQFDLLKRIKELEEQVETKQKFIIMASEVIENSIPEQAVIDKINEYDKKMEEDAGHPHWVVTDRIVMNVLQELLEGGK